MKALVVVNPGPLPSSIEVKQVDHPLEGRTLGSLEVLIKVVYAGINFIDVGESVGTYKVNAPHVLGHESAGIILEVGSQVKSLKKDDMVSCFGIHQCAEYAIASEGNVFKVPLGIGLDIACSLTLQGMTAAMLLTKSFAFQKGQSILIHAGAGGMGQLLIQIAHHIGASCIIVSASTEEKQNLCLGLGADVALNLEDPEFVEKVKKATPDGQGVHVVIDGIANSSYRKSLASLRKGGYFLNYGNASGYIKDFSINQLIEMQIYVARPLLGKWSESYKELYSYIIDLYKKGAIKLQKNTIYEFDNAVQAETDLSSRKSTGKLLVKISDY